MGGESLHVKQLAELLRECQVEVDIMISTDRPVRAASIAAREPARTDQDVARRYQISSVFHLHAIGHNRLSWGIIAAVALWCGCEGVRHY